jgi:hypothetical protein
MKLRVWYKRLTQIFEENEKLKYKVLGPTVIDAAPNKYWELSVLKNNPNIDRHEWEDGGYSLRDKAAIIVQLEYGNMLEVCQRYAAENHRALERLKNDANKPPTTSKPSRKRNWLGRRR